MSGVAPGQQAERVRDIASRLQELENEASSMGISLLVHMHNLPASLYESLEGDGEIVANGYRFKSVHGINVHSDLETRTSTATCPTCHGNETVEYQDGIIQHSSDYYDCSPNYVERPCPTCEDGHVTVERCNTCHLIDVDSDQLEDHFPRFLLCECTDDDREEHKTTLEVGQMIVIRFGEEPTSWQRLDLGILIRDLEGAHGQGDKEIPFTLISYLDGVRQRWQHAQEAARAPAPEGLPF